LECEKLAGLADDEDPWPETRLEAIERAAAAICRHHRWTERSVIGHKEWQPGKVDPRGSPWSRCASGSGTGWSEVAGTGLTCGATMVR